MLQPKQNIDKLVTAVHGGIDYSELKHLGISPADVIDFSVSTNPFGPPPGIEETLSKATINRYPDSGAIELKEALMVKLGINPDNLVIGNGSTELIRSIVTAYIGPEDTVIIPYPTYADYEVACHIAGARILKQTTLGEADFRLNAAKTADLIRKHRPKGTFLCNPNNPTGYYLSKDDLKEILSADEDNLVILDEAYIAFTENIWPSVDLIKHGNLVILRSMTKDYALAGLRLGYAISTKSIISVLKRVLPPWNVNSLAQVAGLFAIKADDYLDACKMKIKENKSFLMKALGKLGLTVFPSQANFFLVKVGDATGLRQALLRKGILVRDCTSFGLTEYIRLSPRGMADCRKLLSTIKDKEVWCHVR